VAARQPSPLVCSLGDLLLDVIVRPGQALVRGGDVPAGTRIGAGGQAANVAAWAVALGGGGRYLGKRADDAAGALVAAELERHGVALRGPIVSGRTGVVVSLVDADGERSMASDRGAAAELGPDEVDAAWLDGCDVLHVSGYALARTPVADAAERLAGLARARDVAVSTDVSAATLVDTAFRDRLGRLRPDVLFATEAEREALGGELAAPAWVLKRGERGCRFSRDGESIELPPDPGPVVDTTGAGDALAAGFLLGGTLEQAAARAMRAAARCVAGLGSMPE
jgi:sugar/nucleoside kinase (ribokinase family)